MIFLVVPANSTAKHFLLSVPRMVPTNRTNSNTATFRQLLFCVFADIISVALPLMARLTKMSIAPAKPLSNTATELAFKFNKVFTMFGTVLNRNIAAFWANKFFWFERTSSILSFVHCCHTVLPSSKIRSFAFETHEVGIYYHSILFWLSKVN